MSKVIYASSDSIGMFEELVVLEKHQIVSDDTENEDGVRICYYVDQGGYQEILYFIDKAEI